MHVLDTRLPDGLVKENPFVLRPGEVFPLAPRMLAVFQHSLDSEP